MFQCFYLEMPSRILLTDQAKWGSDRLLWCWLTTLDLCILPGGVPWPGARPGEGVCRWKPAGRAFVHGVWLASARKGDMGPSSPGPITHTRSSRGPVLSGMGEWWMVNHLNDPGIGLMDLEHWSKAILFTDKDIELWAFPVLAVPHVAMSLFA